MIETEFSSAFFSCLFDFTAEVASFNAIANRNSQFFKINGFADEIVGTTSKSGDCVFNLDIARNHNYDGFGLLGGAQPGDPISLHWGWACDRLSRPQLERLTAWTSAALRIANQAI